MCNMFSNVDLYIMVLAKKRGQGTSAHAHCYMGSVESLLAEHDSGKESGQIHCYMLALSLMEL